jgi:hypothetical protein
MVLRTSPKDKPCSTEDICQCLECFGTIQTVKLLLASRGWSLGMLPSSPQDPAPTGWRTVSFKHQCRLTSPVPRTEPINAACVNSVSHKRRPVFLLLVLRTGEKGAVYYSTAGESRGKRCLYETSKVTASDINSTLQEPWPNQISLFSLILSLTSKETVKTRIPTGCAPMIPLKKKMNLEIPTVASFFVPGLCCSRYLSCLGRHLLDPLFLLGFRFFRIGLKQPTWGRPMEAANS